MSARSRRTCTTVTTVDLRYRVNGGAIQTVAMNSTAASVTPAAFPADRVVEYVIRATTTV